MIINYAKCSICKPYWAGPEKPDGKESKGKTQFLNTKRVLL